MAHEKSPESKKGEKEETVFDSKVIRETLNKVVDNAAASLTKLATVLNVSEPTVIFLLALSSILVVGILAICCVRCSRKRKGKKRRFDEETAYNDLYIPDFDEQDNGYGRLSFSLNYNVEKKTLNVGILCATSLKATAGSPMDCYMEVKLVEPAFTKESESEDSMTPQMMIAANEALEKEAEDLSLSTFEFTTIGKPQQTSLIEDSNNPVFNEMITFKLPYKKVLKSWLLFDIIDRDLSGQVQSYGRVIWRFSDSDSSDFVRSMIGHSVAIMPSPHITKCSSEHAIPPIFRLPAPRYVGGHSR